MSVAPTIQRTTDGAAVIVTWTLAQNQVGNPVSFNRAVERTVQFSGVFGGANVSLEGSLEVSPANYFTLFDNAGVFINVIGPNMLPVSTAANHIRPRVYGGNATTNVVCTLLLRMGT